MATMKVLNSAAHIEVFSNISAREAFCCIIEANYNDPCQYEAGTLRRLALEAAALEDLISTHDPAPLAFARSLSKVLESWEQQGKKQIVFYAGIQLARDSVNVVTVGDIRTHLLEERRLVAVTRLHNMIEVAPNELPAVVRSMQPEFLASVPTRSLGDASSPPPELTVWHAPPEYSVVICTSQFHKYGPPEQYLPEVLDGVFSAETTGRPVPDGAIVKIGGP